MFELQSLRPDRSRRIYDLVKQAGGDHERWRRSKDGSKVIEPSDNIHMNTQWTFISDSGVLIACMWWRDLIEENGQIVHRGSSKSNAAEWVGLQSDIRLSGGRENRLTKKIKKAQEFDRLISMADRKRQPVRVVTLAGYTPEFEQAAEDSSTAEARYLDEKNWWVHLYDVWSGDYLLVRDVLPPPKAMPDPFEGAEDPAEDTAFFDWLNALPLSETEKDAIVKARVGQGWFRDALIKRWAGCAMTKCTDAKVLVASHIKPWKHCETRAERLSPANGLLLTPNLDKLFDTGLISFDQSGQIMIAKSLGIDTSIAMKVLPGDRLRIRTFTDMEPFLDWHRKHVFKG